MIQHRITANAETLMRQAPATARLYMRDAVKDIDELFGAGYAAKHPELVAAYMTVAGADFTNAIAVQTQQSMVDAHRKLAGTIDEAATVIACSMK